MQTILLAVIRYTNDHKCPPLSLTAASTPIRGCVLLQGCRYHGNGVSAGSGRFLYYYLLINYCSILPYNNYNKPRVTSPFRSVAHDGWIPNLQDNFWSTFMIQVRPFVPTLVWEKSCYIFGSFLQGGEYIEICKMALIFHLHCLASSTVDCKRAFSLQRRRKMISVGGRHQMTDHSYFLPKLLNNLSGLLKIRIGLGK